ncbi:hypothetical protein ACWIG5_34415 [Streptomyces lydicus]
MTGNEPPRATGPARTLLQCAADAGLLAVRILQVVYYTIKIW